MDVKFLIAGDRAVSVEFGSVISLEVNAKVRALDEKLKESPIEGMVETVPTYCALIVHYRPEVICVFLSGEAAPSRPVGRGS